ncbi:MAG: outer membrane lipid asymmetry maintenance protein MlaD [Desulfobulbaceae bacterium]|nr:outer membrane lipid asymmetry maintenance protein MlaD [Desulfobulbaceae bacterium]
MYNSRFEIFVGIFLVLGLLAFGWLALQLGEVPWLSAGRTYILNAEFNNISGVKSGADIRIAGVLVGTVRDLSLSEDDLAIVAMQIDKKVQVPMDSIASVKSQGIIGDKYIQISLGGDEEYFQPGDLILDTESSVDLESLISKFAFGEVK